MAAVYGAVLDHGFLATGDPGALLETPAVAPGLTPETLELLGSTTGRDGDQPFARLSHLVVAELFGPGAAAVHATNVLLHALTAWLLFAGISRATGRRGPAAFAALVFALHPLAVESIAWAAMRGRVLGGFFFACALYACPFSRDGGGRGGGARAILFVLAALLGLAAHPAVAVLPIVVLALELAGGSKSEGRAPRTPVIAAAVAAAAAFVLAWATAAPAAPGALARIAAAPLGLVSTASRFFLPVDLAHAYPHPALDAEGGLPVVGAGLAWVILAVAVFGGLRTVRRAPEVVAGVLWFAAAVLVSSLLPYGEGLGGDRHAYLALPGLAFAVGAAARRFLEGRPAAARAVSLPAALLLVAAALGARAQVAFWRDDAGLHGRSLAVSERNAAALVGLAADLERRGKLTAAEDAALEALEIRPDDADAHALLGRVAFLRATGAGGQPSPTLLAVAREHLERALAFDPGHVPSHHFLGQALQHAGDEASLAAAGRHFAAAVEAAPWSATDHTRKGMIEIGMRDAEAARASFRRALALDPRGEADAWYGLGLAEYQLSGTDAALAVFTEGLAVEPDHSGILTSRGRTLLERGDREGARRDLERAIQVHPGFADALFEYAQLLEQEGQGEEARVYYERTLARRPTHIRANENVAWLHARHGDFALARDRARAALAQNPERAYAHELMGMLQRDAGAWRASLQHFGQALRQNPNRIDLRIEVALLLAAAGDERVRDPENALALATECVTETKGRNPAALEARAAALAALGRFEEAADEQQRAVELLSGDERTEAEARAELYRSDRAWILQPVAGLRNGEEE